MGDPFLVCHQILFIFGPSLCPLDLSIYQFIWLRWLLTLPSIAHAHLLVSCHIFPLRVGSSYMAHIGHAHRPFGRWCQNPGGLESEKSFPSCHWTQNMCMWADDASHTWLGLFACQIMSLPGTVFPGWPRPVTPGSATLHHQLKGPH